MALMHEVAADGTKRRWTFKEVVQGKPFGHPSHAVVVHFPVAFYFGAVAFDVMSRLGEFTAAPLAATWLIVGALAFTVPAALTGLVDWVGMVPGSTKRRVATRHMIFQLVAGALFATDLLVRWGERATPQAPLTWIVLGFIGLVPLLIGQWLGGKLVYELGMRVRTGKAR